MRSRERFRRAILDNWDLVFAGVAALVVAILGVIGAASANTLTSASLAVLAAFTGVIFRERLERRKGLDAIRDLVDTASGDKPWHLLKQTIHWDLVSRRDAIVSDEKQVRFLQAATAAVWEFVSAPSGGTLVEHTCRGGAVGQDLLEWQVLDHTFYDETGQRYRVIATNGIWMRGEHAAWHTRRKLRDYFPDTNESVTKKVLMPLDELTMKITWPAGHEPSTVRFFHGDDKPYLKPSIDESGRAYVAQTVSSPEIGEVLAIRWDWQP